MDSPITPQSSHGEANPSRPLLGPKCFCEEPTVLRELNGRNVYVCYKYPNHHCRACCPADVMLLDTNRPSKSPSPLASPAAAAAAAQPSDSPLPLSPVNRDVPFGSPLSSEDLQVDLVDSITPSNNVLSNDRTPAGPKKCATPSSRIFEGGAARSLTPLFNGCAAAASRAQQLGGRFAKRRPQALAVAKMQRQISGSSSQERATTTTPAMPGSVSRKRVREGLSPPATSFKNKINKGTGASGSSGVRSAMSVQTVSRGPEIRRAWNGNRGGLHNSLRYNHKQ